MTARLSTLLFFIFAAVLGAADVAPLRLQLEAVPPRAQTPVAANVTLDWRGPGVLEGVLEFRMLFGEETTHTHRTGEVALAPGQKRMRLLLPPVVGGGVHETSAAFVAKNGTRHELGTHTLGVWLSGEPFVIGLCDGRPRADEATAEFWRAISLGTYWKGDAPFPHQAMPAWFQPADAPDSVMPWCVHDLVVVAGDGFRALREKQLGSLAHWVAAGGSVLVLADGPLAQEHLAFLNRLALVHPQRFSLDAAGRLEIPADMPQNLRVDFGRAVVKSTPWPSGAQLDSREWRGAAGFLWKLRPKHVEQLTGGVLERLEDSQAGKYRDSVPQGRAHSDGFLLSSFFPSHPEGIRFGEIALIFIGFLLVVGPLERFVLRRSRKLRWTWVTFPLLCAAAVWLQIRQANEEMGFHDRTTEWTFKDIGSAGETLVETKLAAVFPGNSTAQEIPLGRGWHSRLVPFHKWGGWGDEDRRDIGETNGFLGTSCVAKQQRTQWDGYGFRLRHYPGVPDDSGIRWAAMPSRDVVMGLEKWTKLVSVLDPERRYEWGFFGMPVIQTQLGLKESLEALVGSPEKFLFGRSPRPGADISATAIFEKSGTDVWVVTATRRDGEHRRVTYRRIYRQDP